VTALIPTGGNAFTALQQQVVGAESVLSAVGVLAAIVAIHELGHFLAARLQNIHVSKFSIGFGPKLLSWEDKDIEYSLRAFPLGGFVGFPDDDPDCKYDEDDPNLLRNRPVKDRAIVVSAGVFANCVFAFTILLSQVNLVGLREPINLPGAVVPKFTSESVATANGMKPGDIVVEVDGKSVPPGQEGVTTLVRTIKGSGGETLHMKILRGQETLFLDIPAVTAPDGTGRIGVQLAPNSKVKTVHADGPIDAAALACKEFWRLGALVGSGITQIFTHFNESKDNLSGPVAIVAVGADLARSDDNTGLYQFAAIVNLNLAIVNILPLPALDGGFLAFLLLEAIRGGKKLPVVVEQTIMSSGLLLLLTLGAVLIVRDTLNLDIVKSIPL